MRHIPYCSSLIEFLKRPLPTAMTHLHIVHAALPVVVVAVFGWVLEKRYAEIDYQVCTNS